MKDWLKRFLKIRLLRWVQGKLTKTKNEGQVEQAHDALNDLEETWRSEKERK